MILLIALTVWDWAIGAQKRMETVASLVLAVMVLVKVYEIILTNRVCYLRLNLLDFVCSYNYKIQKTPLKNWC